MEGRVETRRKPNPLPNIRLSSRVRTYLHPPKTDSDMKDPAIDIIKAKADEAFNKNDFIVALSLYSYISDVDPNNGIYHLNRSLANLRLRRSSYRVINLPSFLPD
ncbi:hypothetical protein BT96DRAFT_338595 [Gymnopus androsaceus JB14]|uniref:Uncharacterized protein n=1 Tax=Gymnopus androsaceus JB14 TaxID=1447944 RepID=A0A6A4I8K7_9AGAR|nr:hypothetical protein BT96DRAFT_338595 [Gymnopus androsaceus JB14]